jgi:hypothetical protein
MGFGFKHQQRHIHKRCVQAAGQNFQNDNYF